MNNNKLLMIAGGLIVGILLLVTIVVLNGSKPPTGTPLLRIWGVFENQNWFDGVTSAYRAKQGLDLLADFKVEYRRFNLDEYEDQIIRALADGTAPDILMLPSSWVRRYQGKLSPLTQNDFLYFVAQFRNDFPDIAYKELVLNGQIYSLPLYVDTLALYYNVDAFNQEGLVEPPKTWEQFQEYAEKLTRFNERGEIERSGAAMGTARNINRSTDILTLLMMQSGVTMPKMDTEKGREALQFYTKFANPESRYYTWNDDQHYSIDAFVGERTAMMFNHSYHINTVRSKNPRLNFAIAPVPQLSEERKVNLGTFWTPTVLNASRYKKDAWKYIFFMASQEGVWPFLQASKRPAARKNLIGAQMNDLYLGPFAQQVLTANNWPQPNDQQVELILADMIDEANKGVESIGAVIRRAVGRIGALR